MRKLIMTIAVVLLFAAGCGSSSGSGAGGNVQACRHAMDQRAKRLLSGNIPNHPLPEPAACKGLSKGTIQRIFHQVVKQEGRRAGF